VFDVKFSKKLMGEPEEKALVPYQCFLSQLCRIFAESLSLGPLIELSLTFYNLLVSLRTEQARTRSFVICF